ncbi:hypothetical protein CONPUDRAFT_158102 [Coniophora puteana RWD-64-598 SS2]|uniref:Cyclin N-terminal domain-containing protein n=1 Tax=Coniophora puteana (strain RWD-64-598) TaxID=741705 RepID=A0A5M3MEF7_CONPW|nr:uncharacterized protein CONPUDRAFT_158102 [Coniophora puteana RWD-64-598 SS2]EIW76961.1 hypothetical protein CONPUDRAFT_158102 [Coniophora puteana RWD-64-598 SS2]
MAAVMGPSIAQHPSPFRAAHNVSVSQSRQGFHPPPSAPLKSASTQPSTARDPFCGHENAARLYAYFITHLFACPEYPPSSSGSTAKLPYFIAYALHRTKLHAPLPHCSRLFWPPLFVSAFMIASKVICDDTYSNKSRSIVAQSMFQLREINQMEREMCQYLDWELSVDPVTLQEFEAMIRKDFAGPGPYPTYTLPSPSKAMPPPLPCLPLIDAHTRAHIVELPVHPSPPPPAPLAQPPAPSYLPPDAPETPSLSYSTSSSRASTAPPKTPHGIEDHTAWIVSAESSPVSKHDAMPVQQQQHHLTGLRSTWPGLYFLCHTHTRAHFVNVDNTITLPLHPSVLSFASEAGASITTPSSPSRASPCSLVLASRYPRDSLAFVLHSSSPASTASLKAPRGIEDHTAGRDHHQYPYPGPVDELVDTIAIVLCPTSTTLRL